MKSRLTDLAHLGWNDWLEERVVCAPDMVMARVVAVDRFSLLVMDETGIFRVKLGGGYRFRNRLAHELPCVGDWVCLKRPIGDHLGVVHALLERRTSLRRKASGNAIEDQMIAANVDHVVVVQSCYIDFNLKRLERYLVMAAEGGAEPCILLTKTDLVEPEVLASQVSEIRAAGILAPVFTLSNVTREGIGALKQKLKPAETYCFVGSSGVGKSTAINELFGQEIQQTYEVSEKGEGRHTTVRRELVILAGGALVIDNPGMREFGVVGTERGVGDSFTDIVGLAPSCRFGDCSHASEPGCAVRAAVAAGELSQARYDNFIKLRDELVANQLSSLEKKRKDRRFGRNAKVVKKERVASSE